MTDVVIAGSGAGAGPLAYRLSKAGCQVTVLERGERHARESFPRDERDKRSFFLPDLTTERHHVVTQATREPLASDLGWIATCVGGGTVHMGAYLYRFHPDDFRMRSTFGAQHELADWPYGYRELEPFYLEAEWAVGVSGQATPSSPPSWGSRSGGYPMPPLNAHPLAENLEQAAARRGLSATVTPRAINSREFQQRPGCSYCAVCAGYGCPTGARGSAEETLLHRAEQTGRCHVIPEATVTEILLASPERARGLVWTDAAGVEHRTTADVVCVSCSAVESARLLLLSKSKHFPDGIGHREGLVGRHLQFHAVSGGRGSIAQAALPASGTSAPFLGRSVLDHYLLPPGIGEIDKGGILRFFLPPAEPIADATRRMQTSPTALWGGKLAEALRHEYEDHQAIGFEVFHDFLPNKDTWLELDPEATDRLGRPIARIHLGLPEHHRRAGAWLTERGFELLSDLGAERLETTDLGGTSSYLVEGSCRMGRDPAASVLDPHCRVHGVSNLFVVDGSFMPTSGGAPPTLTILANSFRTANYLLEDYLL